MQDHKTLAVRSLLDHCGGSVVRAFEACVERDGAATAIQFEQESITYAALNHKANGVAWLLTELGLPPGAPVAICLDPGLLTAVAILGVLKAGDAYVPISSADPVERIAYVLRDTAASVLLTEERLPPAARKLAPHAIALDRAFDSLDDLARGNPDRPCAPEQSAYILYTSGSSGSPKGVMVPHESLAYYLNWHCEHLRPAIGDVDFPLTSSMSFAAGLTQFFTPLLLGRTQHIFRQDMLRQPEKVFAWYRAHPGYGLYCVPTLWDWLVNFAERQRGVGGPVVGPRVVLLSGEAATAPLVKRSRELWPALRLWNLYGPTEATANASAGELVPGAPVTLGEPIAGTSLHLVDESMQEIRRAQSGQEGEICISGDGVATGYLNLPELTQERFLPNPFAINHGKRLFRTGDLAMYTGGGELLFVGRRDFQVKIRGYRIECGEIEAALLHHGAVRQAVVVCREHGGTEKALVAYIAFHFARHAVVEELRAMLAARLPDYMIPVAFVLLEDFPLLANGKIDRRRLPAPGRMRPDLGYACVPPRSLRERQLVSVWEKTLGLEGLGVNDNFFDLGGDSLKVAAALARLDKPLHRDVSYHDFFNNPTPAALALILDSLEVEQKPVNGRVARPPRPRRETAFVAPRTALEEMLAGILAEVVGSEPVGADDNFFELGGNSLLAAQAVYRLHEALDVDLPLRHFFETPTPAGLAVAVVQSQAEKAGKEETLRILEEL